MDKQTINLEKDQTQQEPTNLEIGDSIRKQRHEEELKKLKSQIRTMQLHRTEKNRPTVWINKDHTMAEIHFEKKTMIFEIRSIDTETSRDHSDEMAKGSGFRQLLYKTEEEEQ